MIRRRIYSGLEREDQSDRYFVEFTESVDDTFTVELSDDFDVTFDRDQARYMIEWLESYLVKTNKPEKALGPFYMDFTEEKS